jgi:glycine cleavage system protein P-like pyridoxal-binding family
MEVFILSHLKTKGYLKMLKNENQLTEITGFAGTSLQPNSGAQENLPVNGSRLSPVP